MAARGSYRQVIPDIQLSIEKDTDAVPQDGKYYVVREGKIRGTFRWIKPAQKLFNDLVKESGYTPSTKSAKKKSASELATDSYLEAKDFYWADSYKHRGGGGRGGRGGV